MTPWPQQLRREEARSTSPTVHTDDQLGRCAWAGRASRCHPIRACASLPCRRAAIGLDRRLCDYRHLAIANEHRSPQTRAMPSPIRLGLLAAAIVGVSVTVLHMLRATEAPSSALDGAREQVRLPTVPLYSH